MNGSKIDMPPHHQAVTQRFVSACWEDARVVAAFLGGSYASGTADVHSDLDLFLITTDEAYEAFCAARESFVRRLGEPLFLEDFGASHGLLFMLADDTEGELWIGCESRFTHIYGGAHRVLVDKKDILAGVLFTGSQADRAKQIETLRQQIDWFWHDLAHFVKAVGRGQLWFACGQLEVLRGYCVNLARLRHNFADARVGAEPYFKIEEAMPIEQLAPLQATYGPMEPEALRQAGRIILQFYKEAATSLAHLHGISYPAQLERLMVARLEQLDELQRHVETAKEKAE